MGSHPRSAIPHSPATTNDSPPLAAWFLGPRAENGPIWEELLHHILEDYIHWRRNYFPADPIIVGRSRRRSARHEAWLDGMTAALDSTLNELKHHFPFHSPRYIGHMLSEQTLPSVLGLFAGTLYNPNNVTEEAAPITVSLELEVGRMVAEMLGYNPNRAWAHLTSGGTVANIEALWVARAVQLVPFIAREYCTERRLPFRVKRAGGEQSTELAIEELSPAELINIRPNEAIFMLRKLARFTHEYTRQPYNEVVSEINEAFSRSRYNVARRGISRVLEELGMRPVIFASATAHYSIAKAANILGYGEDALRLVDVTPRFHMDINRLREMIFNLGEDEYVAAVVGIVGTTEEGAVDRIHRIRFLRDEVERERHRSYWIHVDAAWGGYIRSLFVGVELPRIKRGTPLEQICEEYVKALRIEEHFHVDEGIGTRKERTVAVRWAEKDTYAAFLAMADADSITVDPHKMGYIPYPAGFIAFRNGLVTELIRQRAQYISDESGGLKDIDQPEPISAVGPYVLEGSKPGSVALGCWLSHKTIPLTTWGHGKIVRTSLLNTKKLFKYLINHRYLFRRIHFENFGSPDCKFPFTFVPLYEPDTNIICFVVRPMEWQRGALIEIDVTLDELNALNERVYAAASVPAGERRIRMASVQPFYVSRTRLEQNQYRAEAIGSILSLVGIEAREYKRNGLFVLRSSVMNPWYFEAEQAGLDYLREFIVFLHRTTSLIIDRFYTNGAAPPTGGRKT